jgi:hypothetical protein
MRNKLWTCAAVLTLLAVLGKFYAKPLLAQARAVLVQNTDEPGRHPYRQTVFFDQTQCFARGCVLPFDAVPAGYRLVITYASVLYGINNSSSAPLVDLVINGGPADARPPTLYLPVPVAAGGYSYVTSSPITFFADAGQRPTLELGGGVVTSNSFVAVATLSGYFVTVP